MSSSSSSHNFSPPLHFPSIKCCSKQSLRKIWPIQLVCLRCIVCRILLFALTLYYTSSFLKRSVQLLITFRNLPDICVQLSGVSNFQQHASCAPNVAFLLISFWTLSQICWWKLSFCWKLLLHDNAGFNFTYIICYTTEVYEMSHAFRLCLI